ncbi:MAG: lactate utilization protein B/C [Sphingobacteriales bacterium 17-39-43]|uniref:LutC/YkgG family protein n=1 Tax=Daejeonella sp. TaxID=2805397 RepID=UPI000BC9554D|nr:LUD domain-containing protein [Daejeonella sp.]OYY05038.1 MAG: lactate utilization protein B/C [Sphingobacteriia bacterium 35-40-5]OYZ31220.1 MAG: lactate utilization protein B/C [Sphingobacteriales bacterium 16-39-50]OZA24099.1 MAG: lactate utilization protein B/C [Sphingobacteriales bacterium 17-39-43]OZA61863.1 MAG: lactate utilization protein B/C [Sphingobacteriales bacterium 39-40-5]HQS50545.1 LUD domain-containing protein [Daejeonella sp.]
MSTREKILAAVKKNQPPLSALPDISVFKVHEEDVVKKYSEMFAGIGGLLVSAGSLETVKDLVRKDFDQSKRILSNIPALSDVAEISDSDADPHTLEDVELAIIEARLAVAENGAVWLTEDVMGHRVLPYIAQHLAVIVREDSIVSTMHDAYAKIATEDYGFGGFIGGPSKTADIEQALVLGAHGPLSMTVYLIK